MLRSQWRAAGCRVRSPMTIGGVEAVELENESLRVTVLAGKGADICSFLHKPTDTEFMWHSPLGIVNPVTAPPVAEPLGCFGDFYEGGWQELFPHASRAAEYRGVKLPQHGEVWALPWAADVVEDSPARVAVRFSVRTRKTPFLLERTLALESKRPSLLISERVTNLSPEPQEFMWGHHPAFGAPFLSEHCRLFVPAKRLIWRGPAPGEELKGAWPVAETRSGPVDLSRMPAPGSGANDMVYPDGVTDGWYALLNERRKVGFALRWDIGVFPVVWVWRCGGSSGTPWHGRAYAVAVEPVSHMPGARERGEKLLRLGPGRSLQTEIIATAFSGKSSVKKVDSRGVVR